MSARAGSVGVARLVVVLAVSAVLLVGGLVAVQLVVGGVPVLDAVLASSSGLEVEDGPAPPLECDGGAADGGVVARTGDGDKDLLALATAERDAWPLAAELVTPNAYRAGDGVVVTWSDASARARLVLQYAAAPSGYVLASRSGCTA